LYTESNIDIFCETGISPIMLLKGKALEFRAGERRVEYRTTTKLSMFRRCAIIGSNVAPIETLLLCVSWVRPSRDTLR